MPAPSENERAPQSRFTKSSDGSEERLDRHGDTSCTRSSRSLVRWIGPLSIDRIVRDRRSTTSILASFDSDRIRTFDNSQKVHVHLPIINRLLSITDERYSPESPQRSPPTTVTLRRCPRLWLAPLDAFRPLTPPLPFPHCHTATLSRRLGASTCSFLSRFDSCLPHLVLFSVSK